MKTLNTLTALVAFGAMLLTLAGCNTEREKGMERAYLKAGQQVGPDMVGWVAVPNTAPEVKKADFSYAVLAGHNVIPATMDSWVAINPVFFSKMTDIKIDAPKASASERWVLKPEGKSVPKDKHGWVAVPFTEPQIEASAHKKDREMAALLENNVVPKEMHGWVAVDRDTLAKLVAKYMSTGPGAKVSKGE
jgi:hypothetical protein